MLRDDEFVQSSLYNFFISDCYIETKKIIWSLDSDRSRRGLVLHLLLRHLVCPNTPQNECHLTHKNTWVRVKIARIKIWDLKYRGSYIGGSCVIGGSYVGGPCVETT